MVMGQDMNLKHGPKRKGDVLAEDLMELKEKEKRLKRANDTCELPPFSESAKIAEQLGRVQ